MSKPANTDPHASADVNDPAESQPSDVPDDDISATPAQTDEPPGNSRQGKRVAASVTKVAGGSLAAMTAAAIGSGLGVAGTVGGAALVSACVAVLDSVYTSSLRHTQHGVEKLVRTVGPAPGNHPTGREQQTVMADHSAPSAAGHREENIEPTGNRTATIGARSGSHSTTPPARSKRRRLITGALAAAGVVFAITLGAIVTIELVSGESFNGKPDSTTFGQAVRGQNWTHSKSGGDSGDSDQPGGRESDGQQDDKHGNDGQQPDDQQQHDKGGDQQQDGDGGDDQPAQPDEEQGKQKAPQDD